MKTLPFIAALIVSFGNVFGQIDYNKIILPGSVRDLALEERLVQLAWKNHPLNRVGEEQVVIMKEAATQDKMEWLRSFSVVGNLNEFVLNPSADELGRAAFNPKYNITGRLDLGLLFVRPSKIREGNHRIRVAEEQVNALKLEIRNKVLKAYQDYLLYRELFSLQNQTAQESYVEFLNAEQKFKDAAIDQLSFERINQNYLNQRKQKLIAENEYLKSKYDLEYLIGVKMEEVN